MMLKIRLRYPDLRWSRIRSALGLFLPEIREHRRLLLAALLCGLGAMLMQLLRPWPIKILFDAVLMPVRPGVGDGWLDLLAKIPAGRLVAGAALGLLAIAVLWGLFSYGQTFLTAAAGQKVVHALRRRAYSHLLRLSLQFHHRHKRGDLVMRMTGDINVMRDALVDSVLRGAAEILLLAAMAAVMIAMDWRLALLALALLPFLALSTFRFSSEIRQAARRQRRNEGRVAAMVSETLDGISVIQAYGTEERQSEQFKAHAKLSLKAGLRTTRLEASMARTVEIVLAAGVASVLWYGVHRVLAGALTPGDLVVFISYVNGAYRPLRRMARISSRLSKAVVCAERLAEVLEERPEIRDGHGARLESARRGRVEFVRVSFGHPGRETCLRRVSFALEPGSLTGLVGPSGAGKSTVVALLLRLHDPEGGKILLDDLDLRRYKVPSLRDQMSVVLQEPILFGTSIRENIAFGKPAATHEEVERAARLANADEFIRSLPDGYDTRIAEAGTTLSGGQRQRIAIARAFIRDVPILLLDEPTFGLDATADAEVSGALERLARDRTTLVVAHRLATVERADRILVLHKGRLREAGTHEELLRQGGWYARNYRLQSRESRAEPPPEGSRDAQSGPPALTADSRPR